MNRRAFLTASAGVITAAAGCLGAQSGGSSSTPSGFTLPSLDVGGSPGGPVALSPPGKVVLLDFFATWCAPCKPEMANLRAARSKFDAKDVHMVSITQESDEAAIKEFWLEYDGTWPVAIDVDLKATKKYNVTGIPTIIVLTPDGSSVWRHTGLAGEDKIVSNIQKALDQASA